MVVIGRAIGRSDNEDRAERASEGATGSSLLANGFLVRIVLKMSGLEPPMGEARNSLAFPLSLLVLFAGSVLRVF